MKVGIFTDIHLNKFSQFSGPDGRFRLTEGIRVLIRIFQIFHENGVKLVEYGGDLFHTRKEIDVDVLNATREAFKGPLKKILKDITFKYAIPGNHDWYDKACSTSGAFFLEEFGFRVPKKPSFTNFFKELEVIHVPWGSRKDQEEYLDNYQFEEPECNRRIVIIHTTPKGSSTHDGFVFQEGIDLVSYSRLFDFIFCGDIHQRQQLAKNVLVVGSPMPNNFGEGGDKGVYIYDTDTNKATFISLKGFYREFIEVDDPKLIGKHHYFKLTTSSDFDASDMQNVLVVRKSRKVDTGRKGISIGTSPENTLSKYIKASKTKLSHTELFNTGRELIS
jgi:DNA repair exonuclease SbcCD nuclease subunit